MSPASTQIWEISLLEKHHDTGRKREGIQIIKIRESWVSMWETSSLIEERGDDPLQEEDLRWFHIQTKVLGMVGWNFFCRTDRDGRNCAALGAKVHARKSSCRVKSVSLSSQDMAQGGYHVCRQGAWRISRSEVHFWSLAASRLLLRHCLKFYLIAVYRVVNRSSSERNRHEYSDENRYLDLLSNDRAWFDRNCGRSGYDHSAPIQPVHTRDPACIGNGSRKQAGQSFDLTTQS